MFTPEHPPLQPILPNYGTRKNFYHLTEAQGLTRLKIGLQLFEKDDHILFAFMRQQLWSWTIPTAVLTSTQLQTFVDFTSTPEFFDPCKLPTLPHITGKSDLRKAIYLGPNKDFTHQQYALLYPNRASILCPYWKMPQSIISLPIPTVRELSRLI